MRNQYLTSRGDICYEFVLYKTRTQAQADRECAVNGGNLVTVKDKRVEDFIGDMLHKLRYNGRVWIGLNDIATEGEYHWSTGKKATYLNWAPHEPTLFLSTIEDCVILDVKKHMQWFDTPCHLRQYEYICEYSIEQDVSRCPADLIRNQYLTARGDICYEFVLHQTKIHTHAEQECAVNGGNLVTVKDKSVEDFIGDMLHKFRYNERVWIGLNDIITEGEYHWSTGEKATYFNWAPHEPTMFLSTFEDCVILDVKKDMQWLDTPCLIGFHHYICEYREYPLVTHLCH
ncbi:C-type mannose receptor 2-like [Gigantopelta aegis]|uniref:C-type mannose receptor 2-like n=1 Tax=Gigantopelta aegis TaxID=1735272 RepID=UPI001B88BE22|nr:C-type mannose receptor 2-like [Gigantopelta aegis]